MSFLHPGFLCNHYRYLRPSTKRYSQKSSQPAQAIRWEQKVISIFEERTSWKSRSLLTSLPVGNDPRNNFRWTKWLQECIKLLFWFAFDVFHLKNNEKLHEYPMGKCRNISYYPYVKRNTGRNVIGNTILKLCVHYGAAWECMLCWKNRHGHVQNLLILKITLNNPKSIVSLKT